MRKSVPASLGGKRRAQGPAEAELWGQTQGTSRGTFLQPPALSLPPQGSGASFGEMLTNVAAPRASALAALSTEKKALLLSPPTHLSELSSVGPSLTSFLDWPSPVFQVCTDY